MSAPLANRTALVTGASRGIGAAIALALAQAGANVAINYRTRAADAEAVAARIPTRAVTIAADVSDAAAVAAMVEQTRQRLGPVDILVNNAGVALIRNLDDLTE